MDNALGANHMWAKKDLAKKISAWGNRTPGFCVPFFWSERQIC